MKLHDMTNDMMMYAHLHLLLATVEELRENAEDSMLERELGKVEIQLEHAILCLMQRSDHEWN
jgi:hypothetical protein